MKKGLMTLGCAVWILMPALAAQAQDAPRDSREPKRPDGRFDEGRFDGERGPGRRGGERGGPMGMRGRDDAQFRLGGLWRGIDELENSATPLSKTQAVRVVALIRPWSNRPQMTEAQAGQLDGQLRAVLTTTQKNTLDSRRFGERGGPERGPGGKGGDDREGRRFGRGPRGEGRGDGPRGDGPRGGRGEGFDPQKMAAIRAHLASYNPFYAPTGLKTWKTLPQPIQQRMTDRYKRMRATLEALSRKSRS